MDFEIFDNELHSFEKQSEENKTFRMKQFYHIEISVELPDTQDNFRWISN